MAAGSEMIKDGKCFCAREEILLPPSGEISFGKSFREFPEHVLHFKITLD